MNNHWISVVGLSLLITGCSTMPQQSEPLTFDRVDSLPTLTKDQIYSGVDQWIATKSKHYKISYKDKEAGTIISKIVLKYPCRTRAECFSYDGNLNYTLRISAKDEKIRTTYDEIVFDRSEDSLNKIAPKHQILSKTTEKAEYIIEFLNVQSQEMIQHVAKGQNW